MVLTVDIGNTKTALGVWNGSELVTSMQASTTAPRDWVAWALGAVPKGGVEGIALASVVPVASDRWAAVALALNVGLRVFDGTTIPLIRVGVSSPALVGPDRVVNVLGALEWAPAPLIVVDMGTATTFDVLDAEGVFVGGAIAPGAAIGLEALVARTDQLPTLALRAPHAAIGRDTVSAMQSGAVLGYASLIDGMVARIRSELGAQAYCVGTGGLAPQFASLCTVFDRLDPWLTLRGLRRAWEATR